MRELPIRPATDGDWPAVARLMQTVFHDTWDDDHDRVERSTFEPARSLVAVDDRQVVGHAGAFTRELTVPGAVIPAGHVTLVGVTPTHRRRRILTRLMHRQLAELPEAVAVLWASEGRIYPRFGYGMAAARLGFSAANREVTLPTPDVPGRLRTGDPAVLQPELAQVYEALRPHHPGWSSRNKAWWSFVLSDPPSRRHGATKLTAVLHEGPDGVDGYALWRVKNDWSPAGPGGAVQVEEFVADRRDAQLALWRFLFSIDLTRTVKRWLGGLGDPLLQLVDEPRQLGGILGDGLFVRIVDLPAALAARRYAAPIDLVLEVTDPLLPSNSGRWRLTGDRAKAECTATTAPADLACDVVDLGAAYLGGTSLGQLAAAGRVRELHPDVLPVASAAFGWHQAPAGLEVF